MRPTKMTGLALLAAAGFLSTTLVAQAADATMNHDSDVYSDRSFSADVVNSVDDGDDVVVDHCQNNWCFIRIPGPNGWVRKHNIDFGSVTPPPPAPPPAPPLPYGPDTCQMGYVWRDAIPGDHVCVNPASRTQAASENASAGAHVNPTGPYGPNTCIMGFVWREAYAGDVVCVTPARRTAVHQENIDGPSHRVAP